jgi:hypothetical protein
LQPVPERFYLNSKAKTSRTGLQTPSGKENVTDGVANGAGTGLQPVPERFYLNS